LAEQERKMIGERTRAGLAALKARGVPLGNRTNLPQAAAKGHAVIAARMLDANMSLQDIAKTLNADRVPTARSVGNWTAKSVSRLVARWNAAEAA
jgi:DNA invertase Pin-like site-specific DNA recombinase